AAASCTERPGACPGSAGPGRTGAAPSRPRTRPSWGSWRAPLPSLDGMDEDVLQGGDDALHRHGRVPLPFQQGEDAAPGLLGIVHHHVQAVAEKGDLADPVLLLQALLAFEEAGADDLQHGTAAEHLLEL